MSKLTLVLLLCGSVVCSAAAVAQNSSNTSNWDRLQALTPGTLLHVHGDKISRTCSLTAVTAEELTCTKGRLVNTAKYTFPRAEVKDVKLTRYTVSTAAGVLIGIGAGGGIGAASFSKDRGLAALAFGIIGGAVGPFITGPTDAFRGPTVYRRSAP